ncbi:HEMK1 methyltransferase, partial [Odontophorus gujanensis]|nr:HEMK1 methyltransferase [Odontophorus gujanensis]
GLMTAPDVISYWQKVFEENGIPEARESSEYIVSFVLGAKTFQSLDSEKVHTPLTATQQKQIQQLSCKRLERMPVQYVLGEWDFQDLTLKMRPPVFIPRPETEDLISLVVEEESRKCEGKKNSAFSVPPPVILEIGCGSGAIALSLLCKIPQSWVLAVDKEDAAVDLTKENVHRLQLQDRIHVLHHNISYGSAQQLLPWGPMDFIVSNPPYVFHEDMASLDAEILRYEDLDALDGGDDGMRVIKTILTLAPSLLKDSGSVFLEVDPRHPDMVKDWLCAHPDLLLTLRAVHKDFCGK